MNDDACVIIFCQLPVISALFSFFMWELRYLIRWEYYRTCINMLWKHGLLMLYQFYMSIDNIYTFLLCICDDSYLWSFRMVIVIVNSWIDWCIWLCYYKHLAEREACFCQKIKQLKLLSIVTKFVKVFMGMRGCM